MDTRFGFIVKTLISLAVHQSLQQFGPTRPISGLTFCQALSLSKLFAKVTEYYPCLIDITNMLDMKRRLPNRRMAKIGFAPPPPLGNFADISYLVEN